ncbi:hypothetical protein AB0M46_41655 [Dactylosporangium sp. NPDC051485]|uniref:hypothetical protein n=1 Tax=Dactylosporangium sp. NPDC051485 TaxID=3154846 RepID=UPI0034462548
MTLVDPARFATLLHPCGRATDTPAHLSALAGGDAGARDEAVRHLFGRVIHQGTPLTATAPAALVVAGLLAGERLSGPANAELRVDLLDFLAAVATAGWSYSDESLADMAPPPGFDVDAALAEALESDDYEEEVYTDTPLGRALFRRGLLGCREAVPALLAAAEQALSDPQPAVRAAAAHAAAACRARTTT